jgi:uncharacterized protein (DUF1015 family)
LANIIPFRAYRYSAKAGDPAKLLTQPYDKISTGMQTRYLASSPYNLVRVILNKDYAGAAAEFNAWIRDGILAQDSDPAFYAYFQEFEVPGTTERALRKGFIGLGKVEDYSTKVVFRHEQTLSGPKKDRRQVLDHTRAHFGQIFMLYEDREQEVDGLLTEAAKTAPLVDVQDEYGAGHRLWRIHGPHGIGRLQALMKDKRLLIADGHHRYETALGYRDDHRDDPAAQYVMMTFVNMHAPGLKILATHRVLRNLEAFDPAAFITRARAAWNVREYKASADDLSLVRIGAVTQNGSWLLERPRKEGELDVPILHDEILRGLMGISDEAVRDERYITYVRGSDAAIAQVREKGAQVAFILNPTPVGEMARIAFGGGVMPQKSTDFYPKLLSGITIYKL